MSSKLVHTFATETRFLIRETAATKKLALPVHWSTTLLPNEAALRRAIEDWFTRGGRLLVLLPHSEALSMIGWLNERMPPALVHHFAMVVVGPQNVSVWDDKDTSNFIVDVVTEKDLKKGAEFHLLRALKHMVAVEEKASPKVDKKTLEKLNLIFIEMASERNLQRLLANTVLKAMELTTSHVGRLYLIQEADGDMVYRLMVTSTNGADVAIEHVSIRVMENSLCGFVSLTGKFVNSSTWETVRALTMPQLNRQVDYWEDDKEFALMTFPLKNSRGEIAAVLQLGRRKQEGFNATYESEDESVLTSFATQAAICLENVDLYADIQRLFDGFVKASIAAIESRDPSTGGHSERVAKMTVALARATTECTTGIYRSVRFREEEMRELEYAALLHDFGKIGIREEVLVKAKKLYPHQFDAIKDRLQICSAAAKISYLEKRLTDKEYDKRAKEVESYLDIIKIANEPTILPMEVIQTLHRIRHEKIPLPDGSFLNLLTEDEYEALAVTQGSLTESERLEIESHVRHTYQFLKMIPWTKDFRHLTEIAYCHHEKLDGSGYPRNLTAHEIPLQSKIMTIADIYDALTAADRWYKEAVPPERALDILHEEVTQGKIDPVLFDLFREKKLYLVTLTDTLEEVG